MGGPEILCIGWGQRAKLLGGKLGRDEHAIFSNPWTKALTGSAKNHFHLSIGVDKLHILFDYGPILFVFTHLMGFCADCLYLWMNKQLQRYLSTFVVIIALKFAAFW
jgi:hypothetical protein